MYVKGVITHYGRKSAFFLAWIITPFSPKELEKNLWKIGFVGKKTRIGQDDLIKYLFNIIKWIKKLATKVDVLIGSGMCEK